MREGGNKSLREDALRRLTLSESFCFIRFLFAQRARAAVCNRDFSRGSHRCVYRLSGGSISDLRRRAGSHDFVDWFAHSTFDGELSRVEVLRKRLDGKFSVEVVGVGVRKRNLPADMTQPAFDWTRLRRCRPQGYDNFPFVRRLGCTGFRGVSPPRRSLYLRSRDWPTRADCIGHSGCHSRTRSQSVSSEPM